MEKNHYSYTVYADPKIAQEFDADRFGGSIGELIKQTQERIVFSTLPNVQGWQVLDLGAGTGRFTLPFIQAGASVTACDASQQMLDILRQKAESPNLQTFVADAHQLQFANKSFDCAMTFRMLLHVIDWKKALAELCRVSRDWLIFDFPPKHGFLLLAPLRHRLSRTSQSYRTFNVNEVKSELRKNGFEVVAGDPGFFLPLAIYRMLNSPSLMRGAEKIFSAIGLTRLAGSPMTVFARRTK